MHSIYEEQRIPLQIRRWMIFVEICRKAKNNSGKIVYLIPNTQLALGVLYLSDTKRYVAFGGVFEYSFNGQVTEDVNTLDRDDLNKYEVIIKRQAFTEPARNAFDLLVCWNSHIKNQFHGYIHSYQNQIIQVVDETELDYKVSKVNRCLLATPSLPLWNNMKK